MPRSGANIHELTGPPSKSPIQLAAAGGHLEVMEEMSRYISSQDWKRRDGVRPDRPFSPGWLQHWNASLFFTEEWSVAQI